MFNEHAVSPKSITQISFKRKEKKKKAVNFFKRITKEKVREHTHHLFGRLPSMDEEFLVHSQHHFHSPTLTSNRELVSGRTLNHT